MYEPDLSVNKYWATHFEMSGQVVLYVGWLELGQPFPVGPTSPEFRNRLKIFCSEIDAITLGIHPCYFCNEFAGDFDRTFVEGLGLGSRDTLVCGKDNILYYIPDLIYHYVRDHDYLPPTEFVEAVLTSPLPTAPEYKARTRTQLDSEEMESTYRGKLIINEADPWFEPQNPTSYKATLVTAKNDIIPLEIWRSYVEVAGGLSAINHKLVKVTGILILYAENEPPVLNVSSLNLVEISNK